jgi:hypothetical protein
MTLAETQTLFYRLLTRTSGVDQETDIERCFLGSRNMSAAERVEVYANMYLWRQVDALREDFPKLAALLGGEGFYRLSESYVKEYPSEHPDLGHLGRHFANFVRSRPDLGRPDLGDLAALEWARTEVFFEAAANPIRADALALLGENFARARVKLVPALRILKLHHDVGCLWRRLEDGLAPDSPAPERTALVVWRRDFEVFHTALSEDEASSLERANTGASLAEVCAAFEGRESPVEAAFGAIASWIAEGWIAGISGHSATD